MRPRPEAGRGRLRNVGASVALLLALLILAAPAPALAQKVRVVTTSADLKSLAEAVGGARVEVESLAAPEQDPHAIEVKPAQLARVRRATVVVRVGLDHEPWFRKLRVPDAVPVVDASRTVRLLQTQTPRLRVERATHAHALGNTHYWLYPENAIGITFAIRDALIKLSPGDAGTFDSNRNAFLERLKKKIGDWEAALAPYRGTKVVVMHDSWSYFADRFGLQIVAAAEPQPEVPPSPAELAGLVERMREAGVKILIAEPHSNAALVKQIAAKSGAVDVTLMPSGYDYIRMLDENVSRLRNALAATSSSGRGQPSKSQ